MSWKDRWTALMWKITFPGEAVPLEILPSNYARFPEEPKKLTLEDALTKAVMLDMQAHPSDWVMKGATGNFSSPPQYINKVADVTVWFSADSADASCTINGIPISKSNRNKIIEAMKSRKGAETLERLVDRIQKVITIKPERIIEEARPKTIDPFSVTAMDSLGVQLEALQKAARSGSMLPPPPKKLVHHKKVNKPQLPKINKPLTTPLTWKGKKIGKLNGKEYKEMVQYMAERGHLNRDGFIVYSFGGEF